MLLNRKAWVIRNGEGKFFNPRNGDFEDDLSITSHVYWDRNRALSVAKGYGATSVAKGYGATSVMEVEIQVLATKKLEGGDEK
jgi:hypothetical protein